MTPLGLWSCTWIFCSFGEWGLLSLWSTGSRCRASVVCGAWAWLLCSMWDLSSWTRDRTCVPCSGRWRLNHWTTREVLGSASLWRSCATRCFHVLIAGRKWWTWLYPLLLHLKVTRGLRVCAWDADVTEFWSWWLYYEICFTFSTGWRN